MIDVLKETEIGQRIIIAAENGPRVPWGLIILVPLVLMALAPAYGYYVKSKRDAFWRAKIAESSSAVRSVVKNGSAEVEATDEELINGLRADAEELKAARKTLADSNVAVDGCTLIPARCLGLR